MLVFAHADAADVIVLDLEVPAEGNDLMWNGECAVMSQAYVARARAKER